MQLPFFNRKKSNKGLIGVDFRKTRVAVAHILTADKPSEKPKLKQCAFEALADDPSLLTEGSQEVIEAQSQALSKVIKTFPLSQFFCNASIEPSSYELLLTDAPNVESSELKQAVRWRIKDQLTYHIDDAVVDVFEIPGQQSGRAHLMYVEASQKQKIDSRTQQLKQSNIDIQSIDIYELSQRNIAGILPEDKDGIVMLRFNEDSGLLTITRDSTLFLTRRIDFGVDRLKQILNLDAEVEHEFDAQESEEIELSMDETELDNESVDSDDSSLDEASDLSEQPAELNEQGKLIVDGVVLEIQRSLDYYISHFNQRPVTKIILAPMVDEVPGMVEYINSMLGIKVEILDFNECLDIAKPLGRELQAFCFDAIGLALRDESAQGKAG